MSNQLELDALDKLRTDVGTILRRYARRAKTVGKDHIIAAYIEDPNADPDKVALEALYLASEGSEVPIPSGWEGRDAATR